MPGLQIRKQLRMAARAAQSLLPSSLLFSLPTCSPACSALQTPLDLLHRQGVRGVQLRTQSPKPLQGMRCVLTRKGSVRAIHMRWSWRNAGMHYVHPCRLNRRLHPSVYCMLQRAFTEQKIVAYKKEGACLKVTACIPPRRCTAVCIIQEKWLHLSLWEDVSFSTAPSAEGRAGEDESADGKSAGLRSRLV